MANKRKHARVSAHGVAGHVKSHDRGFACGVENLSEGGAFVRTPTPIQLGLAVVVELVKPGFKRAVRLSGRVVHVVSLAEANKSGRVAGMAVAFDPAPPETQDRLVALLRELGLPQTAVGLEARVNVLLEEIAARDRRIGELQIEVKRLKALLKAAAR